MALHDVDFIFQKSCQDEEDRKVRVPYLNRSKLAVFIVQLALNLYCEPEILKENFERGGNDDLNVMYISNAVKTLLNIKIKQLFDDIDFRWQEFRDEDLWSRPCELVYTLNHKALKELYETYSRTNRGKNKKPFDADFMIFEDCELMFTKDCRLKIPIRTIR